MKPLYRIVGGTFGIMMFFVTTVQGQTLEERIRAIETNIQRLQKEMGELKSKVDSLTSPQEKSRQIETSNSNKYGSIPSISYGWNNLPWGATLSDFRKRFPQSSQTKEGWLITGEGEEVLGGIHMRTQYALNKKGLFYMVAFLPRVENRSDTSVAIINTFGAPDGDSLVWSHESIKLEVKSQGMLVTIMNTALDDSKQ
jgi:hypothetical protein